MKTELLPGLTVKTNKNIPKNEIWIQDPITKKVLGRIINIGTKEEKFLLEEEGRKYAERAQKSITKKATKKKMPVRKLPE
jgi:hypothetical protein